MKSKSKTRSFLQETACYSFQPLTTRGSCRISGFRPGCRTENLRASVVFIDKMDAFPRRLPREHVATVHIGITKEPLRVDVGAILLV